MWELERDLFRCGCYIGLHQSRCQTQQRSHRHPFALHKDVSLSASSMLCCCICAQLALKCVKNKSVSWERKTMSRLCFVRRLSALAGSTDWLCAQRELWQGRTEPGGRKERERQIVYVVNEVSLHGGGGWVSVWFHRVSALGQWNIVCSTLPSHTNMTSLLWHTGCDLGYSFLFETFCTTGVTSTKLIVWGFAFF